MATYDELLKASENTDLLKKVRVACVVSAETIRTELPATTNHANRMIWAATVFADPESMTTRMLWVVLAQNRAATLVQILGADDATVQSAVDDAVDVFATGG